MNLPRLALATLAPLLLLASPPGAACGGFFCQTQPIDQAGEQIVFRQQGDEITAMVRILYEGRAENFSWVVPVPATLDVDALSLGADATFGELDVATQPRFVLERRGTECASDFAGDTATDTDSATDAEADEESVSVEELAVGPFDIDVVASDDPEAMATWLVDNGYDLSSRGRELIEPYVLAGMKFVALKLRRGETVGSIQPLVMKYTSANPMIPIRLTAVAALDDMGVLTWVVADARAVPDNYLHITPNYARLNWYAGPQNAYASYQDLITAAMDEVEQTGETDDGQGFATDYAGPITDDIVAGLSPSRARLEELRTELARLDAIGGDAADFIAQAVDVTPFDPTPRIAVLQGALPPPDGVGTEIYRDAQRLRENYPAEALGNARAALRAAMLEREIEPIDLALALLPEGAYMTRLYTTLSADEMTVDPTFVYNPDMPGQPMTREAVIDISCGANGTEWTLTLGAGTDREGETVIHANQPVPFRSPPAADGQEAAFVQARTSAAAEPQVLRQAPAVRLDIAADDSASESPLDSPVPVIASGDDDDGFLGLAGPGTLALLSLLALGRRATRRRCDLAGRGQVAFRRSRNSD